MNLVRPKNGIDLVKREIMDAAIRHFASGGELGAAPMGYDAFQLSNWQYRVCVRSHHKPRYFLIQVKEVL